MIRTAFVQSAKIFFAAFVFVLLSLSANGVSAQQMPAAHSPSDQAALDNAPPPATSPAKSGPVVQKDGTVKEGQTTYKTPYEYYLTLLCIALALGMAVLLFVSAWLGVLTPEFFKAFLIVMVVFAALFLIVAGYSDTQTAPVFSLLGTIAGYIFGRSMGSNESAEPKPAGNGPQTPLPQPESKNKFPM